MVRAFRAAFHPAVHPITSARFLIAVRILGQSVCEAGDVRPVGATSRLGGCQRPRSVGQDVRQPRDDSMTGTGETATAGLRNRPRATGDRGRCHQAMAPIRDSTWKCFVFLEEAGIQLDVLVALERWTGAAGRRILRRFIGHRLDDRLNVGAHVIPQARAQVIPQVLACV